MIRWIHHVHEMRREDDRHLHLSARTTPGEVYNILNTWWIEVCPPFEVAQDRGGMRVELYVRFCASVHDLVSVPARNGDSLHPQFVVRPNKGEPTPDLERQRCECSHQLGPVLSDPKDFQCSARRRLWQRQSPAFHQPADPALGLDGGDITSFRLRVGVFWGFEAVHEVVLDVLSEDVG